MNKYVRKYNGACFAIRVDVLILVCVSVLLVSMCVYRCVCMHIYVCVCMYVCMYACIIYIYIDILKRLDAINDS